MDIFREHNCGKTCSRSIIFEWHKRFRYGLADFSDNFQSGRPRNSGDRPKHILISASKTMLQKREELEFAVRRAVAKFGVDFYKDVCNEWVERHMQCAAYGGSYCDKECMT